MKQNHGYQHDKRPDMEVDSSIFTIDQMLDEGTEEHFHQIAIDVEADFFKREGEC